MNFVLSMSPPLNVVTAAIFFLLGHTARGLEYKNSTAPVCQDLTSRYPDLVLNPSDDGYLGESRRVWDLRCNADPSCIFVPKTADEVSEAMCILNKHNAQFAMRGGGHMNYPGANSIENGVLLSFVNMTELSLSDDKSKFTVGPGNKWIDVYTALEPEGLYAIGGRLKTIGVPGLTLIGGVNYYNNKYGFGMDNVLQYHVVLGNGTQVVTDKDSHTELFWALKGGANNYGIVTSFVFQTLQIPKASTTIQIFNESGIEEYIARVCEFTDHVGNDASVGAGGVFNINHNVTSGATVAQILGSQEGTESPPSRFANFSNVPGRIMHTDNVTTPAKFSAQFDSPLQMSRIQFGHHAIKTNATRLYEMYQAWRTAISDVADVDGLRPTFVVNPAPRSAATIAKTNGIGNVWGLNDDESYIWWQVATSWASAADDLRMTSWSRQLVQRLHEENRELGLSSEFIYAGDAAEWQNPFATIPKENLQRMLEVKKTYDPEDVFGRLNWGGFKVGYF